MTPSIWNLTLTWIDWDRIRQSFVSERQNIFEFCIKKVLELVSKICCDSKVSK